MSEHEPETGRLTIETPIYFARGLYWKDPECTWQFYDQKAAAEIYNQQQERDEAAKRNQERDSELKRQRTAAIKLAFGVLVVLAIVVIGGPALWEEWDESGYISHVKMTTVYSHDWTNGEYKECNNVNAKTEEPYLQCDDLTLDEKGKIFEVRFYGQTYVAESPFETLHFWECRKGGGDGPAVVCRTRTPR